MQLNLAYGDKIDLVKFPSFEERVKFVEENLLFNDNCLINNPISGKIITYEDYYNIRSLKEKSDKEEKQMRDRWLGINHRISGNGASLKNTLNSISSYLLSSEDLSVKNDIHEFKKLKRKSFNKNYFMTKEEKNTLNMLKKNVLFYKLYPVKSDRKDIVFYVNVKFENLLKKRLGKEKSLYRELFKKIVKCNDIRSEVCLLSSKHKDINKKINQHKNDIKLYYHEFLKSKSSDVSKKITETTKCMRALGDDIQDIEFKISMLHDDYMQITEGV